MPWRFHVLFCFNFIVMRYVTLEFIYFLEVVYVEISVNLIKKGRVALTI